eukprot:TRINITY_DN9191_c0_g2_i2.p2 TRINITY_DN9191_c0_g2~~TRINITY_DN9191_c0_g2_i2.p2  ORF type:complete len:104 (+),score=11.30 TRINITY_DN9191_c0_g2_i2:253-564(+)
MTQPPELADSSTALQGSSSSFKRPYTKISDDSRRQLLRMVKVCVRKGRGGEEDAEGGQQDSEHQLLQRQDGDADVLEEGPNHQEAHQRSQEKTRPQSPSTQNS